MRQNFIPNLTNMKKFILTLLLAVYTTVAICAQDIKVTGTVLSASDDEPLIGASVVPQGSTLGVVTDFDGNFTISVPEGTNLTFTSIGYKMVTLKAEQGMVVKLEEDSQLLDELVVVGYSVEKKKDLTGSVSVVKMKDVSDTPTGNVMQALQGRVAGMTVTTDGTPGGGSTGVSIRGQSSFRGEASGPLYVIDGVMTRDNPSTIINSNDIESIQVLKDAASAAIYGAQSANGVIIITTKRAKAGNIHVTFDMSWTMQNYRKGLDLLDAYQWGEVYWNAYRNANGVTPSSSIYGSGATPSLQGYANANGLSAIYSGLMAERIRPDGGGGQYSGNSGGFDQIGFSTLMGYRPFQAHEIGDEIDFECIADTWIRQDSPTVINGTGPKIELRMIEVKNDDGEIVGANYHAGLISFRYDLPEGKEVEQALLHLVSERVKGGDVRLYSYSNNFDEAKACWNTESKYAENFGEPITTFTAAGQKNKAIYDGGITSDNCNLDAWTNNIDITEYVKSLPEGTRRVNLMMKEDGDQVCFFSKDNQGQEKAFKDTEGMTDLLSSQLKPYLKVIFSKDFTDSDEDGTLGTAPIAAYEGKMEYFNIQGIRISTPRKGEICIVKKGSTVRKIIYR